MRVLITKIYNDMANHDHDIRLYDDYWQSLTATEAENVFRTGHANIPEVLNSGKKVNFSMHIFVPEWACGILPVSGNKASADPIAIANEVSDPGSVGGKRGPRPTLDWPVIWAGVTLIIHQKKGCPIQDDLVKDISEWCETYFGDGAAPSETVLKENLRCLYQLINGESPNKVFPKGTRPPRKRPAQKRKKIK
jgi:hypothetical protein